MNDIQISQVCDLLGGELIKNSGGKISYLLIDSRKVLFPRESLFFALSGERNNGHFFIDDLYQAGVRNFVVEKFPEQIKKTYPRANFVKVKNTLVGLQNLASWYRSQFKIPIIGISGSNGKTVSKEWIYQCLEKYGNVTRNPKSFNSQVGVPLSVSLLNNDSQIGIFEAGISKPHEMEVLQRIIQPTIGVFTNIGDAHQENFQSTEEKIKEKAKLFSACEIIIYRADYKAIEDEILSIKSTQTKSFCWSSNPEKKADVKVRNIKLKDTHTDLDLKYGDVDFSLKIPFADKASVENAINTVCVLLVLKMDIAKIQQQIALLESVGMRLELKEGINNCTIINDSYNSDLESLRIALDFILYQNQHKQKILLLSDIAQSGFSDERLYQKVAVMIRQKKIDRLIGIGKKMSQFQSFFDLRKDFFESTQDFIQKFAFTKLQNATILLKGARSFEFERISTVLQKQSHRTIFEIDLNAIESNLNYFKNLLKPSTGIIAMLKASSYGSGTFEIANLCQFQRINAIAVAFPDEGVELRENGIHIPIIVMNPEEDNFQTIFEYGLEPQIYNFHSLQKINHLAQQVQNKGYPVHIKLDTGMHRSGFLPSDMPLLLEELKHLKNIKVRTIFSHLSSADDLLQDEYSYQQVDLFEKMSKQVIQTLKYPIKRHILNSAGVERFAKYQFDMVRLGIGLYGVSAIGKKLEQVGTLKSAIAQIKKIEAGKTIGYGRKGIAQKDVTIATVPIGYADGLRRSLSNGVGGFWVNGKIAPIIGNVCMDICMIDISDIPAKEGDSVEVFGKNIPLQTIAKQMNTIPYEVLTSISKRVKRTYLAE